MRFNILAFGDSLTEGYYNGGKCLHPYSRKLTELLSSEFNSTFEVFTDGVSGEDTFDMEPRLKTSLKERPYKFVILLGGTNDIGGWSDVNEIWTQMEKLYTMVERESIVIPITIPESFFKDTNYVKKRTFLNEKIRSRALEKKVPFVDIEKTIPYDEKSGMWDDCLHFCNKGYDELGSHIFLEIKEYLRNWVGKQTDSNVTL